MTAKEGEGESATPARTVTLALRPDQLSAFTLARSLGAIYLALRNPADAAMPGPARAMLRDIRPGDTAPPTRIAYRPTPAAAPRRAVETVLCGERRPLSAKDTIRCSAPPSSFQQQQALPVRPLRPSQWTLSLERRRSSGLPDRQPRTIPPRPGLADA